MRMRWKSIIIYLILIFSLLCIFFIPIDAYLEKRESPISINNIVNDFILSNIVKIKLILNEKVESSTIKVHTENSIVTLRGSVKDQNALNYIVMVVQNIKSVKKVIPELTIENRGIDIPIEFENNESTKIPSVRFFIKKMKEVKEVILNIFHYQSKLTSDLLLNISVVVNNDEYIVIAKLPSIKYRDVSILITNNDLLIISAKIESNAKEDLEYFYKINAYEIFEKSIILPDFCDVKRAKAFLNGHTLTITIPKLLIEKPKPKPI